LWIGQNLGMIPLWARFRSIRYPVTLRFE
jgi:hypothetical protein